MLSLSALLPAAALTRYDDHGDPELTTGERLLVVMRRLGWATRGEINEALGLDDDTEGTTTSAARAAVSNALAQAVRRRSVTVRIVARTRLYRLDPSKFNATRPRGRGGRKRTP